MSHYDLFIGIDYSGAQAPTSRLKALLVRPQDHATFVAIQPLRGLVGYFRTSSL